MICKKVGTVKVPHIVNGTIMEMVQCGGRVVYWYVIDTDSRYYVDSDGRNLQRPPDCPGEMKIYYLPVFLPPGIDDAVLWSCDLEALMPSSIITITWNHFVTPINLDLDAIINIAAKLNLTERLLHFLYHKLPARNTPLEEFCRRCAGDEEDTPLAVCIICRRLYGTEVAPTERLIDLFKLHLKYDMGHERVWDRLADAIDTTLTKEEFNEIIDGIFAVVNGDFDKVPKRLLDIMTDVWEWI